MLRPSKTRKCCKLLGKPKENQSSSGARMALDRPKKAPRSLQDGKKTASDHAGALGRGSFGLIKNGTERTLKSLKMIETCGRCIQDRVKIVEDAQMS